MDCSLPVDIENRPKRVLPTVTKPLLECIVGHLLETGSENRVVDDGRRRGYSYRPTTRCRSRQSLGSRSSKPITRRRWPKTPSTERSHIR
ncbi:hypothetical protein C446_00400 [Halobiforma nitratireducens JCM 10879]|uniref:Uncharacterized protein n=1 Tax=Halobiforma nitratireducens JCM 10879 TaxID=1227454 RepID=M0MQW0_9EURY|nr:hypothetical protein C446_00400 [Halobiforma nitratireducens JCM 10879]